MVARSSTRQSTFGASKPVVSTPTEVRGGDLPIPEFDQEPIALLAGRLAGHHLGGDPAVAEAIPDVLGVIDAGAEEEHRLPPDRKGHHLIEHGRREAVLVEGGFELLGVELAGPRCPTFRRSACNSDDLLIRPGQVFSLQQLADRDLGGDVGEDPPLPLVEHPAVEPVGRGAEADDLEVGG